jgi:hypothetical protein
VSDESTCGGVYKAGARGWQVWCLHHGGELSVWRSRELAVAALDRHRALLAS